MADVDSSILQMYTNTQSFFAEHGKTILISTGVFLLLSAINAVMSKGSDRPKPVKSKNAPQPKWGILRAMNYVVLAAFIGTTTFAAYQYRGSALQPADESPMTSLLMPLMVVWCLCLAYFFGFFGISFTDQETLDEDVSSPCENAEPTAAIKTAEQTSPRAIKGRSTYVGATTIVPKALHDGPICSDPPEAKKPATKSSKYTDITELDIPSMSNEDVLDLLKSGALKDTELEKKLGDHSRAVILRRLYYEGIIGKGFELIPHEHYDYKKVFGANCEIVIGYVPIPLGVVGPLILNGQPIYIPMATTEGCLVASTNRGCKAISVSGGCSSVLLNDSITRAPCLRFPSAVRAAECKKWIDQPENFAYLEEAFNSTTNFGRLISISTTVAGRNAYLRFSCMSGDAMGMNMVSKGCLKAIEVLEEVFPDFQLLALSGNMCTDKKPSAINWLLGRGKSIVVEAVISEFVVRTVLKTNVKDMIDTNKQKNLIGSAMAGSIGGFNAHASNIVTAVFLATGQDPAQNVESSMCLTSLELADDGESLHVSVTMPSVEVGTVGGGTHLPAQAGCLDICGVRGAAREEGSTPGDHSRKLAQIVGGAVLAGELSLLAALTTNQLVQSHMKHNRKPTTEGAAAPEPALRRFNSMPDLSHMTSSSGSTR